MSKADGINYKQFADQVEDHAWVPREEKTYTGLCGECGLARAAHTSGPEYKSNAPRAVPEPTSDRDKFGAYPGTE